MIDQRVDEITELFKKHYEISKKLFDLLSTERTSYELIRGDIESALAKKTKLQEENRAIELQNVEFKILGKKIIDIAKEDAKHITQSAGLRNIEALQMLEEIEKFCTLVERRSLNQHKEKVLAASQK